MNIISKHSAAVASAAILAVMFHTGIAAAQTTNSTDEKEEVHEQPHARSIGSFYFLGGVGFFDFDDINNRLDDNGYSEFDNPFISLGFGLSFQKNRFIWGAESNWLLNAGGEAQRADTRADYHGWYGLFRFGYAVVHYKGLSIYPLLGIGGGYVRMDIAEEQGASFDEVLADPGREVSMRQNAMLLDASLGIDYRITTREQEYKTSYFLVGLRGGYLFAPYSSDWSKQGSKVHSGPDFGITGPTAMLTLGFSSEYKKHKPHKKN